MKKILITMLLCSAPIWIMAQDMAQDLVERAIRQGIVVLRQDYQLLNEDDEPIGNKPGMNCYGRTYTCGVRIGDNQFLVTKDFVIPWINESIVKSNKRNPQVSYSGFLTLNTIDFEQFDCNVEDASEEIANHLYKIEASEVEGFETDEEAGKKKGYSVWLKCSNSIDMEHVPTGLSLEYTPFSITTKENTFVYELSAQPKGNVIGGVFIVPTVSKIGSIKLKVNGMFEKRGGVWKFISLGKDED